MRRLLCTALALAAVWSQAAEVRFKLNDFTGDGVTNARVYLTPQSTPMINTNSGAAIVNERKPYRSDSAGLLNVSNVVRGIYQVTVEGRWRATEFFISVPDTNGVLNATDLICAGTNAVAEGSYAWSIAKSYSRDQVDALLAGGGTGAGVFVKAGTGLSGVTNGNTVTLGLGLVDLGWLGSGTPSAGNFLRGDGTWSEAIGGGGISEAQATSIAATEAQKATNNLDGTLRGVIGTKQTASANLTSWSAIDPSAKQDTSVSLTAWSAVAPSSVYQRISDATNDLNTALRSHVNTVSNTLGGLAIAEAQKATNALDASISNRIHFVAGDVVNMRERGVKVDGTDQTTEIQAVIDAASGASNTFYFPAGTYKISSPIKLRRENTRIIGDGPQRTYIFQSGVDQHGITCEPLAGNYGGYEAMWFSSFEGFCIYGLGRSNTLGAGIYLGSVTNPGNYFADCVKLSRVSIGKGRTTGFQFALCVSNCVSVVAELCEFKYATECVRLAKCDSAWFQECQTGYLAADGHYEDREDTRTVSFSILGGGLGTHILGGEHGWMHRFATISSGSVVSMYGGNFEGFTNAAFHVTSSRLTVINPRMALAAANVPPYHIVSGADQVTVINGNYGTADHVFRMAATTTKPIYVGASATATNSYDGGGTFTLPAASSIPSAASFSSIQVGTTYGTTGQTNLSRLQVRTASQSLQIGADNNANTLTANAWKNAQIFAPSYAGITYNRCLIEYDDWDGTTPILRFGYDSLGGAPGPVRIQFATSSTASAAPTVKWSVYGDGTLMPFGSVDVGSGSYGVKSIFGTNYVALGGGRFYGLNSSLTNAAGLTIAQEIAAAGTGSGISADTGTNIAAYQARIATNDLAAAMRQNITNHVTWAQTNTVCLLGAFLSASNTLTMDNGYQLLQASTDCAITNVYAPAGKLWSVLVVSNATASAITLYYTAPGRQWMSQTTNALNIAAGKAGAMSVSVLGGMTNYTTGGEK